MAIHEIYDFLKENRNQFFSWHKIMKDLDLPYQATKQAMGRLKKHPGIEVDRSHVPYLIRMT